MALCLQPDEGVRLKFQVKVPDHEVDMRSMDMEFLYESAFKDQSIPEACERLLQDALDGDASLFIRSDHIEEAWLIVDPLLNGWKERRDSLVHTYELGSCGPQAAADLRAQDGREWLQVCGGHG